MTDILSLVANKLIESYTDSFTKQKKKKKYDKLKILKN